MDDGDRRAHLIASLDWNVSPLVGTDLYARDDDEEDRT